VDKWRKSIYYHFYQFPAAHSVRRHDGVRTSKYKLIHYYNINEYELFDLMNDPDELYNCYYDKEYQQVREKLRKELQRLREFYKVDQYEETKSLPDPGEVDTEMVLRYTFGDKEKGIARDVSGNGNNGKIRNSIDSQVDNKRSIRFSGDGFVEITPLPENLYPSFRPFIIGGKIKIESDSGVICSVGNHSFGFSLYIYNRLPHFIIRSQGVYYQVKGTKPLYPDKWEHIIGAVDRKGFLNLYRNGKLSAKSKERHFISRWLDFAPGMLSVGADMGGVVTSYGENLYRYQAEPDNIFINSKEAVNSEDRLYYEGLISDIRLYWGEISKISLQDWIKW
jgi:hypothetical protein